MNETGFWGYRRPDGRVGVRNHVLVVPTVICASVVAERVAAATAPVGSALPHTAYCGHPNVGAVLVIALGCEQVVAQHPADAGRRAGKPTAIVAIQSEGGTVRATARATEIARGFADTLRSAPREWCDTSSLILSV